MKLLILLTLLTFAEDNKSKLEECYNQNYFKCLDRRLVCIPFYGDERCEEGIYEPCKKEMEVFCKNLILGKEA